MHRKHSEGSLGKMMRGYKYFAHKWRDRGFISCPNCHRLVMVCPMCHGSLLLPKAQTYPDYLVAVNYAFVECKQGDETIDLWDFSDNQERMLDENNSLSWVFFEIGGGRAPAGREAYLIPWRIVCHKRDELVQTLKIKSIRFRATERSKAPCAKEIFSNYILIWQTGGYKIPSKHPWWDYLEINNAIRTEHE